MPYIRGLVLSAGLVEACQPLRDQLQLLRLGGLRLAVLEPADRQVDATDAPAKPPSHLEGIDRLPCPGSAEAAEAAACSWASSVGLQWPGEVAALGAAGDAADGLRSRLRALRAAHGAGAKGAGADGGADGGAEPLQKRPRLGGDGGGAGAGAEVEVEVEAGEDFPGLVWPEREEADARGLPGSPWLRLRLALGHANLRRSLADPCPAPASTASAPAPASSPPPAPLLLVGTAMRPSREADLTRDGLLTLVPQDGLVFAPLDLACPLEAQLPFQALLHKASDELVLGAEGAEGGGGGGVPVFGPRVQALAAFAAAHSEVAVIDPLEATAMVINREHLAAVVQRLTQLQLGGGAAGDAGGAAAGPRVVVRPPRSAPLASFEPADVEAAAAAMGLPPPYIYKPVAACGVASSHSMGLVLGPQGLASLPSSGLPLPGVLQEFVDHDGAIVKAYVAGDRVFHTVRPSIPNLPADPAAALALAPSGLLLFDSLKSLPTALPGAAPTSASTSTPTSAPAAPAADAPADARGGSGSGAAAAAESSRGGGGGGGVGVAVGVLEAVAGALRGALGLSLFGFDCVVASRPARAQWGTGEEEDRVGEQEGAKEEGKGPGLEEQVVVVDVNYFPSYRGAEGAGAMFRQAVRAAAEAQRQRSRGAQDGV